MGRVLPLAAAVACNLATASPVFAQAWLGPKGEAWFSLTYQNVNADSHYTDTGAPLNQGSIESQSVFAELGYGATDRLALRVSIPYVDSKYTGVNAHMYPIDDGSYHGTFQDFRFESRYGAIKGDFALTPFVAAIIPSHHYEYFGHAVAGLDLKQLLVGTGFGKLLSRAYVQGRYSFAFVEKVIGISHNRSDLDLQLGYFLEPSIQVFATAFGQLTYGGLPLNPPLARATWTAADFHHHVQLTESDLLSLGGGVDFQVTRAVDAFASFTATVTGRSDHNVSPGIGVGFSLGFSPRQVVRSRVHPGSATSEPQT